MTVVKKKTFRKTAMYVLLGLVALGVLAWAAMRDPQQMATVATVQQGALEVTFVEEGKTRLRQRYVVTAPVAGTVRRIVLQPGDAVKAGQPVADIDPAASALLDARSRSQAQAEWRGAQAAADAARQRIAAARSAQALAQGNVRRAEQVAPTGGIALMELDQMRSRAVAAGADLASARADEKVAAERLAAARAVLAEEGRSSTSSRTRSVAAPVDGVVIRRLVESAAPVPVGQVLMEVGDPAALEIESEVLSTDAVRLVPGASARILRWGGDGVLQATVRRIEPGGYTKVSALGVEEQRTRVILDITSAPAQWHRLGDGYRVEVQYLVQQQASVLQVPASALFRAGEDWAVYRLVNGKAVRTPVRAGLRSATAAQVLDGLKEGDSVIVQPDDRIKEGTRIQPAQDAKAPPARPAA